MASASLNGWLERFYNERAHPSMDTHEMLYQLRTIVENIFDIVKQYDDRFSGDIVDSGSLIDRVMAIRVEECDMMFMLDINGQWEQDERYPNYARYKLDSSETRWRDCATEAGYLLPRRVADRFYTLVTQAMNDSRIQFGRIRVKVVGKGSVATTLSAELASFGMLGTYSIDVDMVVAVKCSGWPKYADASWLSNAPASAWPSRDQVQSIKSEGFQLVAKSHYGGGESTKSLWRLCFAMAESSLLQHIDRIEGKSVLCHKKLLVILKCIRKFKLSGGPDTTPIISSYHLKTLVYHQSTMYPDAEDWTDDKLGERFLSAISYLHDCIKNESLPHFFVPSVNLFKDRGVITQKRLIRSIKDNPCAFIENLLKTTRR